MKLRRILLILAGVTAGGLLAVLLSRDRSPQNTSMSPGNWTGDPAAFVATLLDTDRGIRQFEMRVAEDPRDFVSYTILGQLHLRRGRERGDLADFRTAEQRFRHALSLNPEHVPATSSLAAAFASQHKFAEALELARGLYTKSPQSVDALAIIADAYLETGQYKEGEEAVKRLAQQAGDAPAVLARRAQLAELKGRNAEAVALLQRAAAISRQHAVPAPEIAWFETRLADVYFHSGCLAESEQHFQTSLQLYERYRIGLAGLGDVRLAQGKLHEAADLYAKAAAEAPEPSTLFDLGAVYERLGRTEDAARHYERAEQMAVRADVNQAAHYRDLALFYAERPGKLHEALEFAQRDLAIRKDIEGYDTLAWALYKNGRLEEAATAIGEAMKFGTREPSVYFHAGMIYDALQQSERARGYLEQALEISPHMFPDDGHRMLTKLGGTRSVAAGCRLHG
jgi:tetratricopeptide (TPR) repeat protein